MALSNLEKFVNDYSNDVGGLKGKFKADPDGTAKSYGLSAAETNLVKRGDAHEIKAYMKDSYGAALTVDIS
jgi:hypothetical protein